MKNIVIALTALAFMACSQPTVVYITDPPPVFEPDVPGSIKIALYDGSRLMLHDGTDVVTSYPGTFRNASDRVFSNGDILEYFDGDGNIIHQQYLPAEPEAVYAEVSTPIVARASIVYEDEVWTLERIEPTEALSLGAMYREYTRIYRDSEEQGAWYLNQWQVSEVVQVNSGQIIAIDTAGNFHNLTDTVEPFKIYDDGLMIHDVDQSDNSGRFSDYTGTYDEDWTWNWFNSAEWQVASGLWYSSKGHQWSGAVGLSEEANAMWGFNEWPYPLDGIVYGAAPVIIPAAVRYDTGEECTFWIECNTGWLYKHVPSIDRIDPVVRLYQGDGERTTGVYYGEVLRPIYSPDEDVIYYHDVGGLMRYDFGTGLVGVFSVDMEVWVW